MIRKIVLRLITKLLKYYSYKSKRMVACYNDSIGFEIIINGFYEKSILDLLRSKFPEKMRNTIFLDIGANIGNHSLYFSDFFDKIFCFEPQIKTFKILKLNTTSLKNIKLFNYGLAPEEKEVIFNIPYSNSGMASMLQKSISTYKELVKLRPFPAGIEGDIGYIKIDVEGDELNVLKTIKHKIKLNLPIISFEVNKNNFNRADLLLFFKNLGYYDFYIPNWSKNQKNKFISTFYSICNEDFIKVPENFLVDDSYDFTLVTTFNKSSNFRFK